MKKLQLLIAAAAALVHAASAAPAQDVTLRVTPDRDYIYKAGPREVIVQVEVEGRKVEDDGRRVPMNLAIVLDRSGSMEGAKIEKARQAASIAIDKLGDDDIFSLVIYDNETDLLIAPERVGNSSNREELKSRIQRIRPGGGTGLHAGVVLGATQVRKLFEKERVNRVILLSDGIANVGPSRTSDLADLGRELRRESIAVTTVGVGDDYNEDLMTALAEASSANYYYVRDAEKLPGIFAEELGVARSIVARGVTIRITVPEGVRLKEIIGRPEIPVSKRSAEIVLPEYFGAEKRRFLLRCEVEEKRTEPLEIAAVDLSYEPAEGGKAEPQKQAVAVRFTDEPQKSDESLRGEVAREVAVTRNRLAKERAVMLCDEGKVDEAVKVLRSQAAANAAAPAPAQIPALREENEKLESAAKQIDSVGTLDKSRRKAIQFENYQDKYQKR